MSKIRIMNEYLHSPIWYLDEDGIEYLDDELFGIFLNDEILNDLAETIENLYNSYYEFNTINGSCYFNEKRQKKDKDIMLNLLNKLISRINELNDGLLEIEDLETGRINSL